jgi:hypothetical protein
MAEPDLPPGHKSLFYLGVRRVAEKRPPPEVDRAEVERKRKARKQRKKNAAADAAAAGGASGRGHRAGHRPVRAPARARACEQALRLVGGKDCLRALPLDNLARTIAWLHANRYSVYGPSKGQQPATVDHLRY